MRPRDSRSNLAHVRDAGAGSSALP
jgi:hypothetical protein